MNVKAIINLSQMKFTQQSQIPFELNELDFFHKLLTHWNSISAEKKRIEFQPWILKKNF